MNKLEKLLAQQGVFIGAHRGFSAVYPENSLLAVKEAVDLGVDLIEVDVYLSKDRIPVIAHDYRLDRCSTGTGFICDYTVKELKRLDFGMHRGPAFEGLCLPTLEQFLDFMKDYPQVLMDIDLKVYPMTMETAKRVLPMVEAMRMMDRSVFNSIDCDVLAYICDNYGKRTVGAPHFYPNIMHFHPGENGSFSKMWGICIPIRDLCEDVVRYYRDIGIAIVCTPADTPTQVELATRLNVTLPLCDDPREYLRVAAEKGLT